MARCFNGMPCQIKSYGVKVAEAVKARQGFGIAADTLKSRNARRIPLPIMNNPGLEGSSLLLIQRCQPSTSTNSSNSSSSRQK
jgi:hypothetical protein